MTEITNALAALALGEGGSGGEDGACDGEEAGGGRGGSDLGGRPAAGSAEKASAPRPTVEPLAGLDGVLTSLREAIWWPVEHREAGETLGVRWPRGVVLHGPPGCGKSAAVRRVCSEGVGARVLVAGAPALLAGSTGVGAPEARLRALWAEARRLAASDPGRPVVVLAEDLDALCPARGGPGVSAAEGRLVAQLLTLLDGSGSKGRAGGGPADDTGPGPTDGRAPSEGHVLLLATVSSPSRLDPALRRAGRLEREIAVPVPGLDARRAILGARGVRLPVEPAGLLDWVAEAATGCTGADLIALLREAVLVAARRRGAGGSDGATAGRGEGGRERGGTTAGGEEGGGERGLEGGSNLPDPSGAPVGPPGAIRVLPDADRPALTLTRSDFEAALRVVRPSVLRQVATELRPVAWEEVGGLPEVKARLQRAVEWPIRKRAAFARLGIRPARGVLLHGPPGTGKTTLARAAATGAGVPVIALSAAEAFSAYVGEGEALLRARFAAARRAAPAVLLLDEVDVLVGRREGGGAGGGEGPGGDGGSQAATRLLSTFLTELDGLEAAEGLLVVATSNRPGAIDEAMLRPGRLDVTIYVPPPDAEGRLEVLRVKTSRTPLDDEVDLAALAAQTPNYTGAELEALCREAAIGALREGRDEVTADDFATALLQVRPALTDRVLARFAGWARRGVGSSRQRSTAG